MNMTPVQRRFVLHWGGMGSLWGLNRTVAQIHALLYLSPRPLSAEEIAATLSVARSNVSTSLRELKAWGIVRVVHVLGDRRDHFESMQDVWAMFEHVLEERKRREVDPTLALLRASVEEAEGSAKEDAHTRRRLRDMLEFFETMSGAYEDIRRLPSGALRRLAAARGALPRLLKFAPRR